VAGFTRSLARTSPRITFPPGPVKSSLTLLPLHIQTAVQRLHIFGVCLPWRPSRGRVLSPKSIPKQWAYKVSPDNNIPDSFRSNLTQLQNSLEQPPCSPVMRLKTRSRDLKPNSPLRNGDCQTFLEDDALQPSPLSKKRKRIAEGLQNNVLEPSRSSKRLRGVAEGS
jgi:hypothetical protein